MKCINKEKKKGPSRIMPVKRCLSKQAIAELFVFLIKKKTVRIDPFTCDSLIVEQIDKQAELLKSHPKQEP